MVLAFALVTILIQPTASAQPIDHPCNEDVTPEDGFQSQGIGLTRPELQALYGPGEAGQGSWQWPFGDGSIDLHQTGCDLILAFPQDGLGDVQIHEFALAESLLPADAAYAGAITLGATIAPNRDQTASLWRSDALAERFALLGENRGGEILIVYSYEVEGFETGPIQRVELRTVEMPE